MEVKKKEYLPGFEPGDLSLRSGTDPLPTFKTKRITATIIKYKGINSIKWSIPRIPFVFRENGQIEGLHYFCYLEPEL